VRLGDFLKRPTALTCTSCRREDETTLLGYCAPCFAAYEIGAKPETRTVND